MRKSLEKWLIYFFVSKFIDKFRFFVNETISCSKSLFFIYNIFEYLLPKTRVQLISLEFRPTRGVPLKEIQQGNYYALTMLFVILCSKVFLFSPVIILISVLLSLFFDGTTVISQLHRVGEWNIQDLEDLHSCAPIFGQNLIQISAVHLA